MFCLCKQTVSVCLSLPASLPCSLACLLTLTHSHSHTHTLTHTHREQESELQSLRASQQELEALNASILSRNRDLQAQLDRKTRELDTAIASSSSSSLLNSSGGVTHITATLDFDLSQLTGVQVNTFSLILPKLCSSMLYTLSQSCDFLGGRECRRFFDHRPPCLGRCVCPTQV